MTQHLFTCDPRQAPTSSSNLARFGVSRDLLWGRPLLKGPDIPDLRTTPDRPVFTRPRLAADARLRR